MLIIREFHPGIKNEFGFILMNYKIRTVAFKTMVFYETSRIAKIVPLLPGAIPTMRFFYDLSQQNAPSCSNWKEDKTLLG